MIAPNGSALSRPLVAILPRGEAIRNFVYTGALDIVAKHAPVSLLSIRPNDEIWSMLTARYSRVDVLPDIAERRLVWHLRETLDMAHGRWLWSRVAQDRWRWRDSEAAEAGEQVKRLAKKLVCYPFANRLGLTVLSRAERLASRWLRTSDDARAMLRDLNPALVFNGSHVHSKVALPSVEAAQALGIPTATFIFSWDNLTSQGRLIPRYDYYMVWNDEVRDQLLWTYPDITERQVYVTGTPQFDFHFKPELYWSREKLCAELGANPKLPLVVYTGSMARPTAGEPEIVDGIARMLRSMTDLGPPRLVVRVYPKDQSGRFESLKRRCPDILFPDVAWESNWLTPKPEDSAALVNLLRHADVGINAASTVSLELCMFGRPVINVGYNPPGIDISPFDYRRFYDFDHYRPVTKSGAISIAWSEAEMPALIRRALSDPSAARPQQQALIAKMFGGLLDGASGERVAGALLQIMGVNAQSVATARTA